MSSFKRKAQSSQRVLPGTRISPISTSTIITSTGIPSLDDLLGGGIPLSCTSLILTPDPHSSYGDLVQKYFVVQGLAAGHSVWLVGGKSLCKEMVKECMWLAEGERLLGPISAGGGSSQSAKSTDAEDDEGYSNDKIKIAWRYGGMKRFQTTVETSSSGSDLNYCSTFDLTKTLPQDLVDTVEESGQLTYLDSEPEFDESSSTSQVLLRIHDLLSERSREMSVQSDTSFTAVRICIPALGSSDWGDISDTQILHFLHSLRNLLRQHTFACASIGLPAHISADSWSNRPAWTQKMSWLADAAITMSAFSADPSLTQAFPAHHGIVRIHSLPCPHTLLPPSDKLSMLRGLHASSSSDASFVVGGGGENNLAFKCTRKKLVFETLHLDVEGGVGERRTKASEVSKSKISPTPKEDVISPNSTKAPDDVIDIGQHQHPHADVATVEIGLDGQSNGLAQNPNLQKKKAKKTVAFRSDRPELYEF